MYQCGKLVCDDEYIGETSRTLGERYKVHLMEPSPIHAQNTQTRHNTTPENFQHYREGAHGLARTIKEYIYIRVNNPTLNRNIGNTESYLTPVTLKLTLPMGMHIEHALAGMLSPFHPIGI